MKSTTVDTYTATIYCGCRIGYTKSIIPYDRIKKICQKYCDTVGLCVTVSPTYYIYKDGNEMGAIIGLINYPRFPSTEDQINEHALEIARLLLNDMHQFRVTVKFPTKTVMLEKDSTEDIE